MTFMKPSRPWVWTAAGAAAFIGFAASFCTSIHPARADARGHANAGKRAWVAVVRVQRANLSRQITIPAEFRPYAEVELHAKVSGYLRKIAVDFGDKVKAGESIAVLEVPELDDELANAVAREKQADANYANAHLIYTRLVAVNAAHPNLVAEQDLDNARTKDQMAKAAIAAAKADVDKYQTLVAYTHITAPFDGVVTKRYADPGALIQAGTSSDTQSMPIVRVADEYRLRLDFPVTVDYVRYIHRGEPVKVHVQSLGEDFDGKIRRFTSHINTSTRTMTTEVVVPNPGLKLVPGMYAAVTLDVQQRTGALAVPIQAVLGDKTSPTVYVVGADGRIERRAITLGMETPSYYQVTGGLRDGDLVVVGDTSNLTVGGQVHAKVVDLQYRTESKG